MPAANIDQQAVLLTLQQQLRSLHVGAPADAPPVGRGSGPRLFCGHVPPEATEELVKAHFSQWGTVSDVYFPKNKHTFRRRPFCFVTFATLEAAQRALAESPMNICGIPIKQLTMVEDRMDYYKNRNVAAQNALVQALQTLALVNSGNGNGGAATPPTGAPAPPLDLSNLAALLALESAAGVRAPAPAPYMPPANSYGQQNAAAAAAGRLSAGVQATPFPGMLSPADLAAATASLRLSASNAYGAYVGAPPVLGLGHPSCPSSDGQSYSLRSTSIPPSSATPLSSIAGSPGSNSPPHASGLTMPAATAYDASLRAAEIQAIEAASWGLTGGAFPI